MAHTPTHNTPEKPKRDLAGSAMNVGFLGMMAAGPAKRFAQEKILDQTLKTAAAEGMTLDQAYNKLVADFNRPGSVIGKVFKGRTRDEVRDLLYRRHEVTGSKVAFTSEKVPGGERKIPFQKKTVIRDKRQAATTAKARPGVDAAQYRAGRKASAKAAHKAGRKTAARKMAVHKALRPSSLARQDTRGVLVRGQKALPGRVARAQKLLTGKVATTATRPGSTASAARVDPLRLTRGVSAVAGGPPGVTGGGGAQKLLTGKVGAGAGKAAMKPGLVGQLMKWGPLALAGYIAANLAKSELLEKPGQREVRAAQMKAQQAAQPEAQDVVGTALLQDLMAQRQAQIGPGDNLMGMMRQQNMQQIMQQRAMKMRKLQAQLLDDEVAFGGGGQGPMGPSMGQAFGL